MAAAALGVGPQTDRGGLADAIAKEISTALGSGRRVRRATAAARRGLPTTTGGVGMRANFWAAAIAAVAVSGCGATKTVTDTTTVVQTQTQTVTTVKHSAAPARTVTATHVVTDTVTAPAASAASSGGYASGYPLTFEESFDTQCVDAGGTSTSCACALKQIETSVPYSTVVGAMHEILIGNPPSWYTDAATACAGQ